MTPDDLRRILERPPEEILAEVEASGLRGRSSWAPVAPAWRRIVAKAAFRPYVIANAACGGAGAVRQRRLLDQALPDLLAGILIASRALRAELAFVYLRGDLRGTAERIETEIDHFRADGLLDKAGLRDLLVHRAPTSYVAGEATALLEVLEGKPPLPRQKPSDPAEAGLWGLPTAVHAVETFACLPRVLERGAVAWRASETTWVSVTGRVARPGVFEVTPGLSVRELIESRAGGLVSGRRLAAFFPAGPGSAPLGPEHIDLPLLPEAIEAAGSHPGPLDLIVVDDAACPVGVARSLARIDKEASCGLCPPCTQGTGNLHTVLSRLESGGALPTDPEMLNDLIHFLHPKGQCALPRETARSVGGLMRLFPQEFADHAKGKGCPRGRPAGDAKNPESESRKTEDGNRKPETGNRIPAGPPGEALERRIARYPDHRGAFVDLLWRIQDEFGWVPGDAAGDAARRCGVPLDRLRYDLPQMPGLRLRSPGGPHLKLCGGLPCALAGIDALTPALKAAGIGRQTAQAPAEAVTAEWADCLGVCDRAPACRVGDVLLAPATPESLGDELKALPGSVRVRDTHRETND